MTSLERMTLWFELNDLQEAYVSVLDNDRLEDWPALFVVSDPRDPVAAHITQGEVEPLSMQLERIFHQPSYGEE